MNAAGITIANYIERNSFLFIRYPGMRTDPAMLAKSSGMYYGRRTDFFHVNPLLMIRYPDVLVRFATAFSSLPSSDLSCLHADRDGRSRSQCVKQFLER